MERCARCHRELMDATQRFCSECNRGVGTKPGRGTRPSLDERRRKDDVGEEVEKDAAERVAGVSWSGPRRCGC